MNSPLDAARQDPDPSNGAKGARSVVHIREHAAQFSDAGAEPCSAASVAIVGMSCIFPRASSLKGYWHVLRAGIDCIQDIPPTHWRADDYVDADPKSPDRTYCKRGAFLQPVGFDPSEFHMPPNVLEATDTSQILGLVAARAALEDAGYGADRVFDRTRTSVILGVTGCLELVIPLGARLGHPIWRQALRASGVADDVAEEVVRRISSAYVPWQEGSFPGLLGNVVAGRIANRLDLHGTNCVVDAACASSTAAAHLATLELLAGRADMVVSGGVDTFNDIFMFMCFSKTPALSPTGDVRPFGAKSDGTLLGEGIGVVVLKRLADAERDGDRIYAVIRGIGTSSDGEGQAIYAPSSVGQQRCLEDAYRSAGVNPASVGLVEAHGTGTKVGDVVEFEALRAVYAARRKDAGWCALGTVKSQIGHTKAAAGAAGLIKAALALHHKVLPPTLKANPANPKLNIEDSPFYLSRKARPWVSADGQPRRAAVSAFGFGGSNFHIVLEEHGVRRPSPAWDGSTEILALSADQRDDLERALRDVREALARDASWGSVARLAWRSRQAFSARQRHRLVLVLEEATAAQTVVRAMETINQEPGDGDQDARDPDLCVGEGEPAGKVAFMFPGQGSQYLDMGADLACVFPEMLFALEAAERACPCPDLPLSRCIFSTASSDEARAAAAELLTRTDVTQPALGAIETGMLQVLRRFGVEPHFACGHSYGELVALHAAGRFDAETLHRLSSQRGLAISRLGDGRGSMICVSAPIDEVERLLADVCSDVTLANRNAPRQAILSGTREALDRAAAVCRARGFGVRELPVSTAFHSPLVADARAPFRAALEDITFESGHFPVYANLTAAAYPSDAAACRDVLADQLVCPVDFMGQIESLYAAGTRIFIEVGPRAVLCGLVRAILGTRPHQVWSLDASAGRASGLRDLARVLAGCSASGIPVDLTRWETAPPPQREKKMEVMLVGANYRSPRPSEPTRIQESAVSGQESRTTHSSPTPPSPGAIGPAAMTVPERLSAEHSRAVPREMLEEAFRSVGANISALQALQQQTAAAHQRFLEGQEMAQRTFQRMLDGQQRLVERLLGTTSATPPASGARSQEPVPADHGRSLTPVAVPEVSTSSKIEETPPPSMEIAESLPTSPAPLRGHALLASLETTLLALVAEKTGYPVDMLHLDMDLESDLGIDSIKRVEILAGMEERVPYAAHIQTDRMGSLRSLREVVELLVSETTQARVTPQKIGAIPSNGTTLSHGTEGGDPRRPTHGRNSLELTLLEVVADKTGYPRDMLGLDMDLESDLGIDSIKRVEILAAMEERFPHAARIETDRMGSLRTLRQVVDTLAPSVATVASPNGAPASSVAAGSVERFREAGLRTAQPGSNGSKPAPVLLRQVLVTAETARSSAASLCIAPGHEIRVTDDDSGLAASIVAALRRRGHRARLVDLAEAGARAPLPCGGLIIVGPAGVPTQPLSPASIECLKAAFRAAAAVESELRAAGAAGGALLATVTRMDGEFGFKSAADPICGGLSGLPKTAMHEWTDVCCRAIDVAPAWDSASAAESVVTELGPGAPLEVGLAPGKRFVLTTEFRDARSGSPPLSVGDLVVVSGGARGVTAEATLAMARQWHPTLVLLGRSPVPVAEPPWLEGALTEVDLKKAILHNHFNGGPRPSPADLERAYREYTANREILATLRRLREAGVNAVYRSVDIRDTDAVAAALSEVRSNLGPIRGLVHAAGVLADRRIADKTSQQFDVVVDTKLVGLRNLLVSCADDDLRVLVLFSSVTARFGRPGQVDYCMANEALNKIAHHQASARSGCKVVSINWGPWDGGMVTDALRREFARIGVGLIPLQAGAQALVRELAHPEPDVEVLIGNGLPVSSAQQPCRSNVAACDNDCQTLDPRPRSPEPLTTATTPTGVTSTPSVADVLEIPLSLDRCPFLASHRLGGRPVVPMALMVEWMGHAALHQNPGLRFVGIDGLVIRRGVTVEDRGTTRLRFMTTAARTNADGTTVIDVEASGEAGTYAIGRVLLAEELPLAPVSAPGSASERPYPVDARTAYSARLFHGPHFHAIRTINGWSQHGLSAELLAAPRPAEWLAQPLRSEWLTDPLILDGGLQMGVLWCFESMGVASLPTAGARYRQYVARFPRENVMARLVVRNQNSRSFTADITFSDANGRVLARCEGFEWAADASLGTAFASSAKTEPGDRRHETEVTTLLASDV